MGLKPKVPIPKLDMMGLEPTLTFVLQSAYIQQSAKWLMATARGELCWSFKATIIKGLEPKNEKNDEGGN